MVVTIGAILGGVATSVTALLKFADNKLIAYLLVLLVLSADTGVSSIFGYSGAAGAFASFVFAQLGIPILISSFQLMIVIAILPLLIFAVKASAS